MTSAPRSSRERVRLVWWRDRDEHGAMARHRSGEVAVEGPELLLPPEITHRVLARDAEIGPAHADLHRHLVAVEQTDRKAAIRQRPRPDLELAVARDTVGRLAEGV